LAQNSITRTINSLSRARPAPSTTRPANAGTRNPRGLTRPAQESILQSGRSKLHGRNHIGIIM